MAWYYKRGGDGVLYDRAVIDIAEKADEDRLSLETAKAIVRQLLDGGRFTDVERATLRYILKAHHITPAARKFLQAGVRAWRS